MQSILTFFVNLTGGPRKGGHGGGGNAPKSPEQRQYEMIFHTPIVHQKVEPTEYEREEGIRVKETRAVPIGDALKGKDYILVYYSASWCPPCRRFTPALAEFYKNNHANPGKTFEIVLVSWDDTFKNFANYFKKMPAEWFAVAPSAGRAIKILSSKHEITSIPSIVVIDAKTNAVVSRNGRSLVEVDTNGALFPWDEETMKKANFFEKNGIPFSSYEQAGRFCLTVGGGACGLYLYRNYRSGGMLFRNMKNNLATRINNAAQKS